MRLTCPNCAAHYEVDAALIPDEGRDVQCSNCGKTWFELPATPPVDAEEPTPVISAPVADAIARSQGDEADASEWDEPEDDDHAREEAPRTTPEEPQAEADPAPETVPPVPPKRRDVDPRAMDILKEEAAREIANRKREREAVEVQSEFNLAAQDDGDTPSRALRARMARLRGESEPRPVGLPSRKSDENSYRAPERELLPDIDEINSSLRPANSADDDEDVARADFRRGFGIMVGLAAVLVVLYIAAPAIARTLPGLQPTLTAYVSVANDLRDFVDGIVR